MILIHANHGFMNACRSRSENERRASPMPSGSTTPKNAVCLCGYLSSRYRYPSVLTNR